jgi:hypothetical protein
MFTKIGRPQDAADRSSHDPADETQQMPMTDEASSQRSRDLHIGDAVIAHK